MTENVMEFMEADLMYMNDIYAIPAQDGEKKVTLTIEPSFRKPTVCFEFYENANAWTVYWNFSMPFEKLRSIARERNLLGMEWEKVRKNEEFLNAIQNENSVFSHVLDDDTVNLLRQLCENGLPAPDKIPWGFDGHHYIVKIEESGKEYVCWCFLPSKWVLLAGIINKCVEYAQLNRDGYGCRVQK